MIGAAIARAGGNMLIAGEQGMLIRVTLVKLRRTHRGSIGEICIKLERRDDKFVGLLEDKSILLTIVLKDGRSRRIATKDFLENGRQAIVDVPSPVVEIIPVLTTT